MAEPSKRALNQGFSRKLQAAMVARGWNQSDLARQAAIHMPDKKFGRDNVSKYLKGTTTPLPLHLNALSKALGMSPEDLLPDRGRILAIDMEDNPSLAMRAAGEGTVFLRINQTVPTPTALKIVELLGKH